MTEQELIILLCEGNEEAFRELVSVYRDGVYNTVLGILQHKEDAEDISQDVFIQVYRSIKSFVGNSSLSTWLYRIAVNRSYDHLRSQKRKKRFGFVTGLFGAEHDSISKITDFSHPGLAAEQKEKASILFKAVKQLPQNQQAAFILNKTEGLSYSEIGKILGLSESAVDSLLQRAKQNLRKLIDQKNIL